MTQPVLSDDSPIGRRELTKTIYLGLVQLDPYLGENLGRHTLNIGAGAWIWARRIGYRLKDNIFKLYTLVRRGLDDFSQLFTDS